MEIQGSPQIKIVYRSFTNFLKRKHLGYLPSNPQQRALALGAMSPKGHISHSIKQRHNLKKRGNNKGERTTLSTTVTQPHASVSGNLKLMQLTTTIELYNLSRSSNHSPSQRERGFTGVFKPRGNTRRGGTSITHHGRGI